MFSVQCANLLCLVCNLYFAIKKNSQILPCCRSMVSLFFFSNILFEISDIHLITLTVSEVVVKMYSTNGSIEETCFHFLIKMLYTESYL